MVNFLNLKSVEFKVFNTFCFNQRAYKKNLKLMVFVFEIQSTLVVTNRMELYKFVC
jgi:hypothetical protein